MTTYVLTGGIQGTAAERHVVAATMTPAFHDVPAWRFRVLPGQIRIEADAARFRTRDDPEGRSVHLNCGAALLNLRLAAAQLSREPVVRLLPDRAVPTLLATIRIAGPHRTAPYERLLYATTMRTPPTPAPPLLLTPSTSAPASPAPSTPPPPIATATGSAVANELVEAARLEGGTLYVGKGAAGPVLATRGDGPTAWLRAGQALQRIVLVAATRNVAVSFQYDVEGLPEASEHGITPQVRLQLAQIG